MKNSFYNGNTSNIAYSSQWWSEPLCVAELEGLMDGKFDACAHELNKYINRLIIMQIRKFSITM